MTTTKINLHILWVNLNQGFLMDGNHIEGAFNTHKKRFVLKEGVRFSEVVLPNEIQGFSHVGQAGHFTAGYWNFNTDSTEEI